MHAPARSRAGLKAEGLSRHLPQQLRSAAEITHWLASRSHGTSVLASHSSPALRRILLTTACCSSSRIGDPGGRPAGSCAPRFQRLVFDRQNPSFVKQVSASPNPSKIRNTVADRTLVCKLPCASVRRPWAALPYACPVLGFCCM